MSADAVTSRENLRNRSPLRQSQSAKTRQAIFDSARDFLRARPFREMTVAGLMNDTGLSRPAFYQYFAELQELMEALILELRGDFEAEVVHWLAAEGDPVPGLARTLWGVVDVARSWGPLIRAVVEAAPTDARLEEAWNDLVSHYDDAVTTRIEMDQASGRSPEFDARYAAVSLDRMNVATFVHHFGQAEQSDPRDVWNTLARLWICTIYGDRDWERVKSKGYNNENAK
jgi:AcrR family transcriptional regulator